MNDTVRKFGHPQTLVAAYDHWVVLVRREQVTAGSLVLACTGDAERLPDVPAEAWAELPRPTGDLERALKAALAFEKINYLALMMVDRQVHFHVFPRYEGSRSIGDLEIQDAGWPGRPDLAAAVTLDDAQVAALRERLRRALAGTA